MPGWDSFQPHSRRVVDSSERQQEQDKLRIPASVKKIAGGKKNIFAQAERAGIEDYEHDREEQEELRCVEEHCFESPCLHSPIRVAEHPGDLLRHHGGEPP